RRRPAARSEVSWLPPFLSSSLDSALAEADEGKTRRLGPAASDSALVRALAGVLLAARVRAALQAGLLAGALALDGEAFLRGRRGGALAVGFGDDLVAHDFSFAAAGSKTMDCRIKGNARPRL